MIESLSLLGIHKLSGESFDLLSRKLIKFVDLSPSSMGIDLATDRLNIKVLRQVRDYMLSSNVSLNAVQGVFFGIDTHDSQLLKHAEHRLKSICDAMDTLDCENIYIGAPSLRASQSWSSLMDMTFTIAESRSKRVIVENICHIPCSQNLLSHYAGLNAIDLENVCVDISNFAECEKMTEIFKELFLKAKYVHLSGQNHSLPQRSDLFFTEMQSASRRLNKCITYEFLGYELDEMAYFFDET